MSKNSKRKHIFHASFKTTNRTGEIATSKIVICLIGALAIVAAAIGLLFAFKAMQETWLKQSVIADIPRQVTIHAPAHITKDTIREAFGLKEGENIAKKDFNRLRKELMDKYPIIRSITIERQLPDKVEIFVEEREPVAKLEIKGRRNSSGLVVDKEGVVFDRRKDVDLLPSIYEKESSSTARGQRLEGKSRAALELVKMVENIENMKFTTIDATRNDYILAAMANNQLVKIAWEGMMEKPSPSSLETLRTELFQLRAAIETSIITTPGLTWYVLDTDRVSIVTKDPL